MGDQPRQLAISDLYGIDFASAPGEMLDALYDAVTAEYRRRKTNLLVMTAGGLSEIRKDRRRKMRAENESGLWSNTHEFHDAFNRLMAQDWLQYFPVGDEERRYYVYMHLEPSDDVWMVKSASIKFEAAGVPFYIGKGTGQRAFQLTRNDGHGAILRRLKRAGVDPSKIVKIVADGLTERESLALEAKLVHFFGSRYDTDDPGLLVNLRTDDGPVLKPNRPVLRNGNSYRKKR